MDQEQLDNAVEGVEHAIEHMIEAIEALQGVVRQGREANLPYWFTGQLEAYTIGNLERFCQDGNTHQPGNLPHLLEQLRNDDDESDGS